MHQTHKEPNKNPTTYLFLCRGGTSFLSPESLFATTNTQIQWPQASPLPPSMSQPCPIRLSLSLQHVLLDFHVFTLTIKHWILQKEKEKEKQESN